jgi:hypothetical protein
MEGGAANYAEGSLRLDLQKAKFIDPIALLALFAAIVERVNRDLETELLLPESKRMRDYLRAWNFDEAIKQATGREFHTFVSDEDRRYFGEEPEYYLKADANSLEDYLAAQRFFGLMARRITSAPDHARLVEQEWSRWRSPLIIQVLNRHLSGPSRDVARVVIYELLTNAVQHPGANSVTVVSSVYGKTVAGSRDDRSFAVGVWDDGEGIVETLRSALALGSIRAGDSSSIDEFTVKAIDWRPRQGSYHSDWTPASDAADEELLLASLFQGISQKPVRADIEPISMPGEDDPSQRIGDGLHALYRCVIDQFGGSIAVRSGSHFMNVKSAAAKKSGSYAVKLTRYPEWPPFAGNMITVRIPLGGQR